MDIALELMPVSGWTCKHFEMSEQQNGKQCQGSRAFSHSPSALAAQKVASSFIQ